jgi:hypothetical protein
VIGIDEVLSHHPPQRRIIVDDQDMAIELLSSLREAAVGGVGRCSEGSAKELRVLRETAIEAIYFPPHS